MKKGVDGMDEKRRIQEKLNHSVAVRGRPQIIRQHGNLPYIPVNPIHVSSPIPRFAPQGAHLSHNRCVFGLLAQRGFIFRQMLHRPDHGMYHFPYRYNSNKTTTIGKT